MSSDASSEQGPHLQNSRLYPRAQCDTLFQADYSTNVSNEWVNKTSTKSNYVFIVLRHGFNEASRNSEDIEGLIHFVVWFILAPRMDPGLQHAKQLLRS